MIAQAEIFKNDFGHLFDFSGKSPAGIFNEAILPKVNALSAPEDDGLDEAQRQRDAQLQKDFAAEAFSQQQSRDFAEQFLSRPQVLPQVHAAVVAPESYSQPVAAQGRIKLSNYGYASDSSPDYNSNVARIGHSNNKLENGVSAALTKTLAQRFGIKPGDEFEAVTADGKVLRRRYDDTVPTTYKGKPLPETVDLYDLSGSNSFGGSISTIRPLTKTSN